MNAGAKLGAFAVVLAVATGGGAALGSATGPVEIGADDHGHAGDGGGHSASGTGSGSHDSEELPTGVVASQAGYTLEADDTMIEGGVGRLALRIRGPEGRVVTELEPRHERELHLVVVSADLSRYIHLHPRRVEDGTWTAELPPPALAPGAYRVFADFAVDGGPELVLSLPVAVPGEFLPGVPAAESPTATIDGYDVGVSGTLEVDADAEVSFRVTRAGVPVEDLDPYLGALGHLVVVRVSDLAYLHVHPIDDGGERRGPTVRFGVDVPSAGDYRLFFDFAHGGRPRTAAFTVHVPAEEHR